MLCLDVYKQREQGFLYQFYITLSLIQRHKMCASVYFQYKLYL